MDVHDHELARLARRQADAKDEGPTRRPLVFPGKRTLVERVYGRGGRTAPDARSAPGPAERSIPGEGRRMVGPGYGSPGIDLDAFADADEPALATAAQGVSSASEPLPFAGEIQHAFGRHDIGHVRTRIGGAATTAGAAIGARAYAIGHRVGFASAPDLHTAAHEAAHVVQQEAGMAGSDDELERHADLVADAVVAGRSAEAILDQALRPGGGGQTGGARVQRRADGPPARLVSAARYLQINAAEVRKSIDACLVQMTWPRPHPRMGWNHLLLFTSALRRQLDQALGTFDSPAGLERLIFPASPLELVDALRPLAGRKGPAGSAQPAAAAVGPIAWVPAVGQALGDEVEEAVVASLLRLAPRWLVVAERAAGGPVSGTQIRVQSASLVTSTWMDLLVGGAMCAPGVFDVRPDADRAGAQHRPGLTLETPRVGAAAGATDQVTGAGTSPLRPVTLEWQGGRSPGMWNWVRALNPAGATAEEVAAQLFGDRPHSGHSERPSFLACRLTAAPPFFGVPPALARGFEQARALEPASRRGSAARADAAPDPELGEAASYDQIVGDRAADDAALAQAPASRPDRHRPGRHLHAPAGASAVLDLLRDTEEQTSTLIDTLVPWGLAGPAFAALGWITSKISTLATADAETAVRWRPVIAAQKPNLARIGGQVASLDRSASSLGATDRRGREAAPLREVLLLYAQAIGCSPFNRTCTELMARAARKQRLLPLAAVSASTQEMNASLEMLRAAAPSHADATTFYAAARDRAALGAEHLRAVVLTGGAIAPDELDETTLQAGEVAMQARLEAIDDEILALRQAAHAADAGMYAKMAALPSPDFRGVEPTCDELHRRLRAIRQTLWHELYVHATEPSSAPEAERRATARAQRRQALAGARQGLAALARERDIAHFLRAGAELVENQAFRTACVQIATLIGLTIAAAVTAGEAAAVVGAGLRNAGAATTLVRLASGATALLTETTLNATGQVAVYGGSLGDAFKENLLLSAGGPVVDHAFGSLVSNALGRDAAALDHAELTGSLRSKAARAGKAVAREGAAVAGHTVAGVATGAAAQRLATGTPGGTPSSPREWMLQAAATLVGRHIGHAVQVRIERLRALEGFPGHEAAVARLIQREVELGRMATAFDRETVPDPDQAVALLARRHEVLTDELNTLLPMVKDIRGLLRSGRARQVGWLLDELHRQRVAQARPDMVELVLHLSTLEPLMDRTAWWGTPERVEKAVTAAQSVGEGVVVTRDPGAGTVILTVGRERITLWERQPAPGEADRAAAQRRAEDKKPLGQHAAEHTREKRPPVDERMAGADLKRMPRHVVRVMTRAAYEQWKTFSRQDRALAFATEPADLRGLSPAEAARAIGWTREMIEAHARAGDDLVAVILDTHVAIEGDDGVMRRPKVKPIKWEDFKAAALEDGGFRRKVRRLDISEAELPRLLDEAAEAPFQERTLDPAHPTKIGRLWNLLDERYGANRLFTGRGLTMTADGRVGTREYMVTHEVPEPGGKIDSSKFKLTDGRAKGGRNHVVIDLGKLTPKDAKKAFSEPSAASASAGGRSP